MKPKSLSASSAHVFELCPERWKSSYLNKIRMPGGPFADLGTAVHDALEAFIKADGHRHDQNAARKMLFTFYNESYDHHFGANQEFHSEGRSMLVKWISRVLPWAADHEVLSTEIKESFDIKVTWNGEEVVVPFNYIWDRCDRLPDGEIDVVDYKTIAVPLNSDAMRKKIQVRAYGLAARIKYGSEQRIWVTYDMLRHGAPLGVTFSKDDDVDTYRYLQRLLVRILETSEDAEDLATINDECRWCPKKTTCTELSKAVAGGTIHSMTIEEIANRRKVLKWAEQALTGAVREADEALMTHLRNEELTEFETGDTKVKATARRRRSVDPVKVREIVGDEIFERYGQDSLKMADLDALLDDSDVTIEQKAKIKSIVQKEFTAPSIKTENVE